MIPLWLRYSIGSPNEPNNQSLRMARNHPDHRWRAQCIRDILMSEGNDEINRHGDKKGPSS
jgi:hypothetical protein